MQPSQLARRTALLRAVPKTRPMLHQSRWGTAVVAPPWTGSSRRHMGSFRGRLDPVVPTDLGRIGHRWNPESLKILVCKDSSNFLSCRECSRECSSRTICAATIVLCINRCLLIYIHLCYQWLHLYSGWKWNSICWTYIAHTWALHKSTYIHHTKW